MRTGAGSQADANSMSPRPSSFSAPTPSMMMRESNLLATMKAMRDGMLALIRPVMTSIDGRCVASTMCMPTARAMAASRARVASSSLPLVAIRSANSSMMMTM